MSSIQKHRLSFSTFEILRMWNLVRDNLTPEDKKLFHTLTKKKWEIENGMATPAFETKAKQSIGEMLGFDDIPSHTHDKIIPHATQCLNAYNKWLVIESRLLLSRHELELVNEYRFENDLMTSEEEEAFTLKQMEGQSK